MRLALSTRSPLNSTFTNEDGEVLFISRTPWRVLGRTTTISRISVPLVHSSVIVPAPLRQRRRQSAPATLDDADAVFQVEQNLDDVNVDSILQDRFVHLAQLDWRVARTNHLRIRGVQADASTLFRNGDWGALGRDKIFKAPDSDGREYKWTLGLWTPELYLNDGSKTLVARYHRPALSLFGKSRMGTLEIMDPREEILDMIVITFIYVEKIRKDRERAARHSGPGGAT